MQRSLFARRMRFAICMCLAAFCLAWTPLRSAKAASKKEAPDVLDIGDQRQVFIDGTFLATSHNVELVMHPPRKTHERTIEPDKPWEKGGIGNYSNVMKVGDTYHMWYPANHNLCYARSKDGIHWEKPNIGLASFEGSRNNNIVLGQNANGIPEWNSEGMIFYDPNAPENERFRYATRLSDVHKDTVIFSSPDGLRWRQTHYAVLTFTQPEGRQHLDSQNVIFWDDRINKYVAYMRYNRHQGFRGRGVSRSESDHLGGFTPVQEAPVILTPDSLDVIIDGRPCSDYYACCAIKYPYAQNAYYMFPQAYFHYNKGLLAEFKYAIINAGPIHTQFAASRDGITWNRFGRRPFVDLGMKGSFDSQAARVFYGLAPSVDGNEMYLYYVGSDMSHGWCDRGKNIAQLTAAGLGPVEEISLISRLVLRRDGFVSAQASYSGGEFTTPLLRFDGKELVLNVDTSATGLVRCELLDDRGRPIEGYTLDDCDYIHTSNEINRQVRWQGNSDVSVLAGKPIRLRVSFRDSDLYAFQFRK